MPSLSGAQGMMTVDSLFALLEERSEALRAARSGADVARHGVAEAKSSRLPDIGAQLEVSYTGNIVMTDRDFGDAQAFSTPHWGNSLTLSAQQTIYSGGALSAGVEMAEIALRRAETGVERTRDEERFLAVAQYLELMEADNAARVYESNIALTATLIDDIEAKRREGMALHNDITRYELQMETLRLGLRKTRDRRRVLNHRLCTTLHIDTSTVIMPDTTLLALSADSRESFWQAMAHDNSPQLADADLAIATARQQLRLYQSEMRPTLFAYAADNFSGPYTYDIPPIDNNFNIWQIGVGIRYSLSSLFKSNKKVRRGRAALCQSEETRADAAKQVDNNVNEAHTLYLQAFEDLKTRRKSAQLARENYEVVNARYLNDLALITDMTDASNIRLSAELDETNARIQIVYAYYRMKYVAGDI